MKIAVLTDKYCESMQSDQYWSGEGRSWAILVESLRLLGMDVTFLNYDDMQIEALKACDIALLSISEAIDRTNNDKSDKSVVNAAPRLIDVQWWSTPQSRSEASEYANVRCVLASWIPSQVRGVPDSVKSTQMTTYMWMPWVSPELALSWEPEEQPKTVYRWRVGRLDRNTTRDMERRELLRAMEVWSLFKKHRPDWVMQVPVLDQYLGVDHRKELDDLLCDSEDVELLPSEPHCKWEERLSSKIGLLFAPCYHAFSHGMWGPSFAGVPSILGGDTLWWLAEDRPVERTHGGGAYWWEYQTPHYLYTAWEETKTEQLVDMMLDLTDPDCSTAQKAVAGLQGQVQYRYNQGASLDSLWKILRGTITF